MNAYMKDDALVLVPEADLIASQVEDIRIFFLGKFKENPDSKRIVLDVTGIDVVDSLGVNLIIGLYKEASGSGKKLSLVNAGEKFMKIANFFRFPSILTIEGNKK